MYLVILKACLILFFVRSTIGDECTNMRFLEDRYTCLDSSEQEFFPVKGSCILFIKCIRHNQVGTTEETPVFKCLNGTIFNGTECVQVNSFADVHNCPQRRCFPQDTKQEEKQNREYESTTKVEAKHQAHVSRSRESEYFFQVYESGAPASSSLISFSKIVISVFLLDFMFVICIL